MTHPSTIAVLGGGYAGLFAAHRAARAAAKTRTSPARVVLVDATDDWEERTRWHQLATGQKIRSRPRDRIVKGTGVSTLRGTVTSIDLDDRTLTFAGDLPPLAFDRLVYAAGSRSNAPSVPGALENSHTLDTADTSRGLAQALARQPASRVLVVGGGLTGIQTAAATAQRYRHAAVTLLSSAPIGQELPEKARAYVGTALARLGVHVIEVSRRVATVAPGRVCWDGGHLEADLVVWTAGFSPSPLARQAGLQVTDSGQVAVDTALRCARSPTRSSSPPETGPPFRGPPRPTARTPPPRPGPPQAETRRSTSGARRSRPSTWATSSSAPASVATTRSCSCCSPTAPPAGRCSPAGPPGWCRTPGGNTRRTLPPPCRHRSRPLPPS